MDIDILCKVVDNFGDIGVAYRLARSLSELGNPPRLRLVVDDFASFAALDPEVDASAPSQTLHGWELYRWGGAGAARAKEAFLAKRPRIVIECFACGRPDWLEDILFDPLVEEPSLIVDLEHLTAEPYSVELHRMPSLTRSSLVRKAMFLPGFSAGTGGLILDGSFERARELSSSEAGRLALRRRALARLGPAIGGTAGAEAIDLETAFWVPVFSYERDYTRVVADLAAFARSRGTLALAAAGRSAGCFRRAWSEAGEPFPLVDLPFLPQEAWDEVLAACDFSIVRGEDSWSRAALAGRPFLWQAYPQEGKHQLVKVRAFLDRLRPHFGSEGSASGAAFAALRDLYLAFNDRDRDGADTRGGESLLPVLGLYPELLSGFGEFSASLGGARDLGADLVTFLREIW